MDTQTNIERLGAFEDEVDAGIRAGIIPRLPTAKIQTGKVSMDRDIRRVLVDRLMHLQYLEGNPAQVSNNALNSAIERLQNEANLHTDSWLGYQTWQAIQQVFSFEDPTHLERWIADEKPTHFIYRAAYLRLRAIGIITGEETRFFKRYGFEASLVQRKMAVDSGLSRLREILLLLGFENSHFVKGQGFHIALLDVLFDHDKLVETLVGHRRTIAKLLKDTPLHYEDEQREEGLKSHALQMLLCLSKIELWLHGYVTSDDEDDPDKVVINPKPGKIKVNRYLDSKRVLTRGGKTRPSNASTADKVKDYGLLRPARRFCEDSTIQKKRTFILKAGLKALLQAVFDGSARHVHVALDILVCANPSEQPALDKKQQAQQIVKALKKAHQKGQVNDASWQQVGFGNAFLDGARRIWRFAKRVVSWIVNRFTQMFSAISKRVLQVLRIAKKLAFDGVTILKRAYIAMESGMRLLFSKQVSGSGHAITMVKDTDMDFYVAVNRKASSKQIRTFLEGLKTAIQGFNFSILLFKIIIRGLTVVAHILASPLSGTISLVSKLLTMERFLDDEDCKIISQTLRLN